MSRPSKLTPEAREKFVKAIGAGSYPEVAARFAGFSPASLYRYLRGSTPERAAFRDAALLAQAELEIRLTGILVQEARAEPKWAAFLLERRFRDRWAARAPSEATAADRRPADRRPPEDIVTLDATLIEVLVPKLLDAGERLRSGASSDPDAVTRFEDRGPRRTSSEPSDPR